MARLRIAAVAPALVVAMGVLAGSAEAYEFAINARTIGQARALDSLRILGPSQRLSRRRITQSLQLHLWDLTGRLDGRSLYGAKPRAGANLYFTSYVRVDQDFGSFSSGQLQLGGRTQDALDVIPELQRNVLQLDVLYAYAGAEGLLGGRVDVYLGRLLEVQSLDWFSLDGLKIDTHLPSHIGVSVFGGLRVRENSPLGSDSFALDGTSSALCEEYVEGALPGSGAWRPIDGLPFRDNSPFLSDSEVCPQRNVSMPTVGASIFLDGVASLQGQLSYRRTQSRSVGLIGEPDRLDFEDVGLYPNEAGQTPSWGVNEEVLALSVRAPVDLSEKVQLVPYAAARYSLLHGLINEAHLGTKLTRNAHSLESEFFYSVPTFDGDSIFNVFSTEPYSDLRTTWEFSPKDSLWSGYLRGWGRRFHGEGSQLSAEPAASTEYAGGTQVGGQYQWQRDRILRVDGFHEDGYGGLRSGGYARLRWQWTQKTRFSARMSGIYVDDDRRSDLYGVNWGTQLGTSYQVHKGVNTSIRLEQNSNRLHTFQLAIFAFVDLAFEPEV